MKKVVRLTGKAFQLAALVALPSALWVGQLDHNERGSIAIFVSSILVFFIGYGLTAAASKL